MIVLSLPFLHNLIPVFVIDERLIDAVDHVLAAEDALAGYQVIDLIPQDLSEREATGRDRRELDVRQNLQLPLKV